MEATARGNWRVGKKENSRGSLEEERENEMMIGGGAVAVDWRQSGSVLLAWRE